MRITSPTEALPTPVTRVKEAATTDTPQDRPPDQAPKGQGYISPIIHVDSNAGVAVLQFRDDSTGEVTQQFPSERVVREYQHGEKIAHGEKTAAKQVEQVEQAGAAPAQPAPQPVNASPAPTGGEGGGTPAAGGTGGAQAVSPGSGSGAGTKA
ncbi:MAG: hypothetical protein HZC25_02900 [Rhodospirillales bacterium]|nr:hypothetical protein [Rhodospirillales bacterium]